MSIYVLTTPAYAGTVQARVLPHFAGQGFRLRERRGLDGCEIVLLDNPDTSVIETHETEAGDYIAAIGPFLYQGRGGQAALAAYLDDVDPDGERLWDETEGHFTLIVRKRGRTAVFCDGLGAHKIYAGSDLGILSNSFLAAMAAMPKRSLDPHGCYAYVWGGACFGGRTFVEQVISQPANSVVHPDGDGPRVRRAASPILDGLAAPGGDLETLARGNLERLQARVGHIVDFAGRKIRLSFSGGYDSRLLLATVMATGVRPSMFVYGPEGDIDVRIAEAVAAGEGLPLDRVDKGAVAPPAPDAFPEMVARDLVFFDGWKNGGLIDNGSDHPDRRSRHVDGTVPLNGGLGEIYRNFYNLWNRPCAAEDVVSSFYMSFDPAWATEAFDARAYAATLAAQMRAELRTDARRLSPQQAQLLYPLFRGRYWTAREAEINQRFGWMFFPYLEHGCIAGSAEIPLRYRNLGRAQQAMINLSNRKLAGYSTAYGFPFSQPPGLRYRLNAWKSLMRPMWLRRRSYRLRAGGGPFPPELQDERVSRIIDTSFPYMRRYFHPGHIDDEEAYNRVVTLEYLAQTFGFDDA